MFKKTAILLLTAIAAGQLSAQTAENFVSGVVLFQNANVNITEENIIYRNGWLSCTYKLKNSGANAENLYFVLPVEDRDKSADSITSSYSVTSTLNDKRLNWKLKHKSETPALQNTSYGFISDTFAFQPGGEYELSVKFRYDPLVSKDPEFGNTVYNISFGAASGLKPGKKMTKGNYYFYLPLEGLVPGHSHSYSALPVFSSGGEQWGPYVGFLDLKSKGKISAVEYKLNEILVKMEKINIKLPFIADLSWCNKSWEGAELPYIEDLTDPDIYNLFSGYPYYNKLNMFRDKTWFIRFLLYLSEYTGPGNTHYTQRQLNNCYLFIDNSVRAMYGKEFSDPAAAAFYKSLPWYRPGGYSDKKLEAWAKEILNNLK